MYWTQNTLREFLRDTRWAYQLVRPPWLAFKSIRSALRQGGGGAPPDFYVGGGSWHGNQTIWRMIYDLNLVMQHADANGVLQPDPQRAYFAIVDGLVAGEGDGPLFPRPRELDWLVCGDDPFAIDATLAWFMGFDPERLPIIARRAQYLGAAWGHFELSTLAVTVDGTTAPLASFPVRHDFAPPPGWLTHVERPAAAPEIRAS